VVQQTRGSHEPVSHTWLFMYRLNNTVSDASIELFKGPSSNYQSSIYTNPVWKFNMFSRTNYAFSETTYESKLYFDSLCLNLLFTCLKAKFRKEIIFIETNLSSYVLFNRVVGEKILKCEKFRDDDRHKVMTIPHLSLWPIKWT
jgi:hypothetical protein